MAHNEITSGQFSPTSTRARSIVSNQQQEISAMQAIMNAL
jgi:uncharacterized protein (DUF305 family)